MTDEERGLWAEVHAAFEHHRRHPGGVDCSAEAALDRIAMDCLLLKKHHRIGPPLFTARQELYDRADLQRLRRFHNRARPAVDKEPIVVLEFGDEVTILDGHNRVNLWLKQGDAQLRRAIVVSLRDNPPPREALGRS